MTAQRLKLRPLTVFICIVFMICAGIALMQIRGDKHPPEIKIESPDFLGKGSIFTIHLASPGGIDKNALKIDAIQEKTREQLAIIEEHWVKPGELMLSVALPEATVFLDGGIDVEVSARSLSSRGGLGGIFAPAPTVRSFELQLDLTPPIGACELYPTTFIRGGAALIVIEPGESLSGIDLTQGQTEYAAYQLAPGRYAALLAFPEALPYDSYSLNLRMSDKAGNISNSTIEVPGENFQFRQDPIWLGDKFFQAKKQEFSAYLGNQEASPLELFLIMNSQARAESYRRLAALCALSAPAKLWQGEFLEMPGATRRSEFADRRDYVYKNEVIDKQVHLGLDYASVAKDKIPASNSGIIAFTGYLGIHGNAVLIDHGLGLFSLYSHLSSIEAEQEQKVEKGQIIGRTGATGMAGGDHLHFEILVNGISVNPDFFFNGAWLGENIDAPLSRLSEQSNE